MPHFICFFFCTQSKSSKHQQQQQFRSIDTILVLVLLQGKFYTRRELAFGRKEGLADVAGVISINHEVVHLEEVP
ncbi:hypothetical protein, partial [Azospirillum sp. B506]|uniref:hypothetical protein n=1 Tax=Azospirillum sp. B506 TaxID=137721 RepID=UPI001B3C048A